MQFTSTVQKHILDFTFLAGTSRGVLQQKASWFLMVEANGRRGIGEAGPLPGLSVEGTELDTLWPSVLNKLKRKGLPSSKQEVFSIASETAAGIASIQFALETALLDWLQGGKRILFENSFSSGERCLPINGLIWMADKETMKERIDEKIKQGFNCLKLKIGAIDFEEELSLLRYIRTHYDQNVLSIRVDANGAFAADEALPKLHQLARWELHSIEQPIRQGQLEAMRTLCRQSPLPIALDEELIGVTDLESRQRLLDTVKPPFIILKPGLIGGLAATAQWIRLAEERNIGWWITSALESNIGLNAIAQFTAEWSSDMPQGLGTGQLYSNNIPSPLKVQKGKLCYDQKQAWDLSAIGF